MSVRVLRVIATIISTCDSLKVGVVVIPNYPTIPPTFSKIIRPFPQLIDIDPIPVAVNASRPSLFGRQTTTTSGWPGGLRLVAPEGDSSISIFGQSESEVKVRERRPPTLESEAGGRQGIFGELLVAQPVKPNKPAKPIKPRRSGSFSEQAPPS